MWLGSVSAAPPGGSFSPVQWSPTLVVYNYKVGACVRLEVAKQGINTSHPQPRKLSVLRCVYCNVLIPSRLTLSARKRKESEMLTIATTHTTDTAIQTMCEVAVQSQSLRHFEDPTPFEQELASLAMLCCHVMLSSAPEILPHLLILAAGYLRL